MSNTAGIFIIILSLCEFQLWEKVLFFTCQVLMKLLYFKMLILFYWVSMQKFQKASTFDIMGSSLLAVVNTAIAGN